MATNREVVCFFMIFYLRKCVFFVPFSGGVGRLYCEWRQIGSIRNVHFNSVLRALATNREVFLFVEFSFGRQMGSFMSLFYICGAKASWLRRRLLAFTPWWSCRYAVMASRLRRKRFVPYCPFLLISSSCSFLLISSCCSFL